MIYRRQITIDASMIHRVDCNMCGETAWDADKPAMERRDFLSVQMSWGCSSDKDGQDHQWDLCEKCYDNLSSQFELPVVLATPEPTSPIAKQNEDAFKPASKGE